MVKITTQRHLRAVHDLQFCYLCGEGFSPARQQDHDHVPPKAAFEKKDRVSLKLPTHVACNSSQKLIDEKFTQLLKLRRGYQPTDPNNFRLKFKATPDLGLAAVTNVNIRAAVWRYIRGFHAALYREPCMFDNPRRAYLQLPFRESLLNENVISFMPIRPQYFTIVEIIKLNRALGNTDQIICNNSKLRYDCVWCKSDDGPWFCAFALDIDGWAELGALRGLEKCGCAGIYSLPNDHVPANATREHRLRLVIPNREPYDAFGT